MEGVNVYLAGFMGVGKSAVGRILARRLRRPFVDLDATIERAAGARVAELFARRGEKSFRRLESAALARAARRRGAVVALGGGVLLSAENRRLAKRTGRLVRLTCSRRELARRLRPQRASRPLLAGGSLMKRISALLESRRDAYAGADFAVSTTGLTTTQVAARIARRLR